MVHPAYIREKARELRVAKRLTMDELADRLAIPRATIYYWVRDLPIGQTNRQARAAFRGGQVSRRIHRNVVAIGNSDPAVVPAWRLLAF
jgi:hypothetical protein